jgi:hypothetical protein
LEGLQVFIVNSIFKKVYSVIPPKSFLTRFVYIFSLFQAFSLYIFAFYFDGIERFWENVDDLDTQKSEGNEDLKEV